ncbi:hypothetical protein EVAR_13179_1 [Eumeta japonica]|uniref:Uncharacterized protein n=1 Tax=Eumeta variegata TaxID=151549 RepID=A0A4C1TS10_EUMVA|nr:hypothetical protein EVAR_13179_1 [Eumeta japonica]
MHIEAVRNHKAPPDCTVTLQALFLPKEHVKSPTRIEPKRLLQMAQHPLGVETSSRQSNDKREIYRQPDRTIWQTNLRTATESIVIAAHRHLQPRKNHQCVVCLSSINKICDGGRINDGRVGLRERATGTLLR